MNNFLIYPLTKRTNANSLVLWGEGFGFCSVGKYIPVPGFNQEPANFVVPKRINLGFSSCATARSMKRSLNFLLSSRFGEQLGSTFLTIAAFKNGHTSNQAHTMNIAQLLESHNQKRNQALLNMRQVRALLCGIPIDQGNLKNLDLFFQPGKSG